MPEWLRVDNGHPWGRNEGLPSALALWVVGLGVGIIWNPPARPQENAKVERFHGLLDQWVEPERCRGGEDLQRQVNWAARVQREEYRGEDGLTRNQRYPQLAAGGRSYRQDAEAEMWDIRRVQAFLAQMRLPRHVGKTGQITLYNRNHSVGRKNAGQDVGVGFDAATNEWVVRDSSGKELTRFEAAEVCRERIMALDVGHEKPGRRKARCSEAASQCPQVVGAVVLPFSAGDVGAVEMPGAASGDWEAVLSMSIGGQTLCRGPGA